MARASTRALADPDKATRARIERDVQGGKDAHYREALELCIEPVNPELYEYAALVMQALGPYEPGTTQESLLTRVQSAQAHERKLQMSRCKRKKCPGHTGGPITPPLPGTTPAKKRRVDTPVRLKGRAGAR